MLAPTITCRRFTGAASRADPRHPFADRNNQTIG